MHNIFKKQPTVDLSATSNAIDFREELIEKIVHSSFFRRYNMDETITNPFILWVTTEGQNYQTEVRKPDFIKSLRKAFDDAELPEVGNNAQWIVKTEPLPESAGFYRIDEGIYLDTRLLTEQEDEKPKIIPTKARISIADSSGSLLQREYLLDAEKQQVWQIGRGEKNRTGKKNHITINDSENDRRYDNNKYVSNIHAQIIFIANKGFCVKSLNDNNRTIVYRNENRISDIRDLHSVSVPLQDGDRIELGKKVLLKFEIVTD
jgi:hypothetical protein